MINAVTADRLRMVLLEPAAGGRHATVVLDMTGTRFCDASAHGVLIRAHKRIRPAAVSCGWSSPLAAPSPAFSA